MTEFAGFDPSQSDQFGSDQFGPGQSNDHGANQPGSDQLGSGQLGSDQPGAERSGRIRVFLAEDHQIVAEGLTSLLESYPDIEVLGWVPSVAEAVRAASEWTPDVVLLDFRLADGTGADAAAGIREV